MIRPSPSRSSWNNGLARLSNLPRSRLAWISPCRTSALRLPYARSKPNLGRVDSCFFVREGTRAMPRPGQDRPPPSTRPLRARLIVAGAFVGCSPERALRSRAAAAAERDRRCPTTTRSRSSAGRGGRKATPRSESPPSPDPSPAPDLTARAPAPAAPAPALRTLARRRRLPQHPRRRAEAPGAPSARRAQDRRGRGRPGRGGGGVEGRRR